MTCPRQEFKSAKFRTGIANERGAVCPHKRLCPNILTAQEETNFMTNMKTIYMKPSLQLV